MNYPGAVQTNVQGISDSGLVVGHYDDASNPNRGFLYDGSTYFPIDVPGATWTNPNGVNSHGAIVGGYVLRDTGVHIAHGFLFDGFEYHTINHPNGPQTTNLQDITDDWEIVGTYQAPDGLGPNHGFTATIDKPAAPALRFKVPPNYEAPTDSNGDNLYEVIVQASDGKGGVTTQTIRVTVTPVNDNRPVITSPDAVSVAENTTGVLTVTATDADLPPQAVTFSIVGGVDQARFNITPSGVLSFNTPPNFEAPTDANGDNVYVVIVQASDGSLPSVQAILVTVTDVVSEPLVGDYNNNGTVDSADYVLWRNGGPLQNEGVGPGAVTQEDYNVWRGKLRPNSPGSRRGKRALDPTAAGDRRSTWRRIARATHAARPAFREPAILGTARRIGCGFRANHRSSAITAQRFRGRSRTPRCAFCLACVEAIGARARINCGRFRQLNARDLTES